MKRIAAACSFCFVLLSGCNREQPTPEKIVTPVRVTAVDLYQPKAGGRYSASILPGRQVAVSFRVSGVVAEVSSRAGRSFEPGDIVESGTVLARLREEDYRIATEQAQGQLAAARQAEATARAQLAQARASQVKAEADFARAKTLMDSKSLTQPEFDAARAQLDVSAAQTDAARCQVESATAHIRTAEAGLAAARLAEKDTVIQAPFTAAVVQRNVEVGMLAGPTQPAYTLADIRAVKAAFGVPDTVVAQLGPGKTTHVWVEALGGREFHGTVSAVASVADAETRLFQVEVTLRNDQMLLKPGMIASLRLGETAAPAPVAVVPLSAVVRDRQNPSEFAVMVVEGKVARIRRVGLGRSFGDVLQITEGLKPGEQVIRAGATMVANGETVQVIP